MQVILRQLGDCIIRRCDPADIISVMEINMKTLPEHYSDYFYESLLGELPEAFLVGEIGGRPVGYIMCKTEYGFSNFKKLYLLFFPNPAILLANLWRNSKWLIL